jgi:hypothetical protein
MYRFQVSALNINGEGPVSTELITYSCTAPVGMPAPWRISSTLITMIIGW